MYIHVCTKGARILAAEVHVSLAFLPLLAVSEKWSVLLGGSTCHTHFQCTVLVQAKIETLKAKKDCMRQRFTTSKMKLCIGHYVYTYILYIGISETHHSDTLGDACVQKYRRSITTQQDQKKELYNIKQPKFHIC